MGVVTTLSQVAGAILYRLFLKRVPLRRLFVVIVVASSMLQCTQLVLITRANVLLGLPDVAFALGDDPGMLGLAEGEGVSPAEQAPEVVDQYATLFEEGNWRARELTRNPKAHPHANQHARKPASK